MIEKFQTKNWCGQICGWIKRSLWKNECIYKRSTHHLASGHQGWSGHREKATYLPVCLSISIMIHNGFKELSESYLQAYGDHWEMCRAVPAFCLCLVSVSLDTLLLLFPSILWCLAIWVQWSQDFSKHIQTQRKAVIIKTDDIGTRLERYINGRPSWFRIRL